MRALHSAIYLVMAAATCFVLCAGITGYRGVWLDAALGLVTIEGVVFVGNGMKCPLTAVAQRNGADKGYVFDTFPNGSPGIPSGSSARCWQLGCCSSSSGWSLLDSNRPRRLKQTTAQATTRPTGPNLGPIAPAAASTFTTTATPPPASGAVPPAPRTPPQAVRSGG